MRDPRNKVQGVFKVSDLVMRPRQSQLDLKP